MAVNTEGTGNIKKDQRDIQLGMRKEIKGGEPVFEESDLSLKIN